MKMTFNCKCVLLGDVIEFFVGDKVGVFEEISYLIFAVLHRAGLRVCMSINFVLYHRIYMTLLVSLYC